MQDRYVLTPSRLKGRELEDAAIAAIRVSETMTGNRYGHKSSFQNDKFRQVKSFPDIEGVFKPFGRQFVIECKVCSGASLRLAYRIADQKQQLQLLHLMRRAEHGAVAFYLVHFNERTLKKRGTIPATTFAVPVHPAAAFWCDFLNGHETTVDVSIAREIGFECDWYLPKQCRRPRLAIEGAIEAVDRMLDACTQETYDLNWHRLPIFQRKKKRANELAE